MRRPYGFGAALICAVALAPTVSIAEPGPSAAELSTASAAQAQGLLPPEILEFYKKGEWKSAIVEWPNGKIRHDKEFEEGSRRNADHLVLDAHNGIIDKASTKKPETIIGFPFPKIDAADPQAGAKIIWNYFYGAYNGGS